MASRDGILRHPSTSAALCAIGSVALGIVYLALAGAPATYLAVNVGALAVGLVLLAFRRAVPDSWSRSGALNMAVAAALLATAIGGVAFDGAARWVRAGPLLVQTSLVLLPAMIVGFARWRNTLSTVAVMIASLALAIQPDRAMAGMLAAGVAVMAMARSDRRVLVALCAALVSFAVTLARPDRLPPAPYVEQILYSAFDVHVLAGLAVWAGSALLVLPALLGRGKDVRCREVYSVFGIVWLAAIAAAALGNYPTPVVGYGGSAILGYLLSLAVLPTRAEGPTINDDRMEAGPCVEEPALPSADRFAT